MASSIVVRMDGSGVVTKKTIHRFTAACMCSAAMGLLSSTAMAQAVIVDTLRDNGNWAHGVAGSASNPYQQRRIMARPPEQAPLPAHASSRIAKDLPPPPAIVEQPSEPLRVTIPNLDRIEETRQANIPTSAATFAQVPATAPSEAAKPTPSEHSTETPQHGDAGNELGRLWHSFTSILPDVGRITPSIPLTDKDNIVAEAPSAPPQEPAVETAAQSPPPQGDIIYTQPDAEQARETADKAAAMMNALMPSAGPATNAAPLITLPEESQEDNRPKGPQPTDAPMTISSAPTPPAPPQAPALPAPVAPAPMVANPGAAPVIGAPAATMPPSAVAAAPPVTTPPVPVAPGAAPNPSATAMPVNPAVPPAVAPPAQPAAAIAPLVTPPSGAPAVPISQPTPAATTAVPLIPPGQAPVLAPPPGTANIAPVATAPAPTSVQAHMPELTPESSEPKPTVSEASKKILDKLPSNLDRPSTLKPPPVAIEHGKNADDPFKGEVRSSQITRDAAGMNIEVKATEANLNYELERAYNALIAGQTSNAIDIYKSVLANDPHNKLALFGLATTYHRIGLIDKARPLYGQLLSIDPSNRDALNNFLVLLADEAPEEALTQLEKLRQRNPAFSPIPAQMAVIYQKMGKTTEAVDYMYRAIDLSPENMTYRYNLAIMLDKQGKWEDAAKLYKQILNAGDRGEVIPGKIDKIQQRLTFISSNKPIP